MIGKCLAKRGLHVLGIGFIYCAQLLGQKLPSVVKYFNTVQGAQAEIPEGFLRQNITFCLMR